MTYDCIYSETENAAIGTYWHSDDGLAVQTPAGPFAVPLRCECHGENARGIPDNLTVVHPLITGAPMHIKIRHGQMFVDHLL